MRKWRSRALAMVMTGMMLLQLAGCGNAAGTSTKESQLGSEDKASVAEEVSTAEESDIQASVDEIKIGMVNPLSGDNALYGMNESRGMQLAFEEINEKGGIYGAKLTLVEYDDLSDPQNAAKGAQKFVDDDSILAMVGSSLSSCTLALAPIIDDGELVDVVVSSSSPSLTGCSDYFFRMAVQDVQLGPQMAKVILNEGLKDVVVLYTNNDFGINLCDNFSAYAKDNGANILDQISYSASDQDFTAILTKVKEEKPEAVALCGTVTDCSLIIKQMDKLGIEAFRIGATSLYSQNALEIGGDAMEGVCAVTVYISSNPDPKIQEFVAHYETKYGETPDAFSALAYDMAYVLAEACKNAMTANDGDIDRESIRVAMDAMNFEGITGTVSFDENNDWVRDYLTVTVKDGEFTLK